MYFNMPRHVFGNIQAKLWPIYFKLGTVLTVLALLSNGAVLKMKGISPTPMGELQVSIMRYFLLPALEIQLIYKFVISMKNILLFH